MNPRAERTARGASIAAISVMIAAAFHLAAGGAMPGLAGVAIALVIGVLAGTLAAGCRWTLPRLGAAVTASQFAFHGLFTVGAPTGLSSTPVDPHAGHLMVPFVFSGDAMVGDGINDAPALAQADIGIAMGAGGTRAAIEAADIALMTDDLNKIVGVRAIARRAYRTIQENLFVGVGVVHILGITAALLGWIGPVQAALIHLGPDILVFLNSTKLLTVRIKTGPTTSLQPLERATR